MLVLSRKTDESLLIGDDIKVTVLDIRGGQVRIGISAPASVASLEPVEIMLLFKMEKEF